MGGIPTQIVDNVDGFLYEQCSPLEVSGNEKTSLLILGFSKEKQTLYFANFSWQNCSKKFVFKDKYTLSLVSDALEWGDPDS